jgi:hypothetical protein
MIYRKTARQRNELDRAGARLRERFAYRPARRRVPSERGSDDKSAWDNARRSKGAVDSWCTRIFRGLPWVAEIEALLRVLRVLSVHARVDQSVSAVTLASKLRWRGGARVAWARQSAGPCGGVVGCVSSPQSSAG